MWKTKLYNEGKVLIKVMSSGVETSTCSVNAESLLRLRLPCGRVYQIIQIGILAIFKLPTTIGETVDFSTTLEMTS